MVSIEPGRCVMELEIDERHTNPFGTGHGGLICDLADAAMGAACHSMLADDQMCSTLELKTSFLRPALRGKLLAEGRVIKDGRTVSFIECDVKDEKGDLIARATATLLKSSTRRPRKK
ncbi:MAG: PaaI family thioesterase [Chloroflexi bacterium]|nr:PaaI family thioesterase [Chloroflexota bacterium]